MIASLVLDSKKARCLRAIQLSARLETGCTTSYLMICLSGGTLVRQQETDMSVLEVNNASIRYMTGDFKDIGLKEYVTRRLTHNYSVTEFWADQDISFSLEKGDMLGIIGSNGAGKSTLLKAVAGIMEPTYGSVRREGSIAALLELGSGFDGDLTVRENTYLRGALLGYTRKFMDDTYDSIIEFAELQDFQDRPFKQLSSGMQSRLAFSIASLVQPDILILDEILSVGDGAFRKKSEDKMKEIIRGGATTILVSHSLDQVREMCTKVLWLHKGEQIAFSEDVQGICDQYEDFLAGKIELPKRPVQEAKEEAKDAEPEEEAENSGGTDETPAGGQMSFKEEVRDEFSGFRDCLSRSRKWILISLLVLIGAYSAWLIYLELRPDRDITAGDSAVQETAEVQADAEDQVASEEPTAAEDTAEVALAGLPDEQTDKKTDHPTDSGFMYGNAEVDASGELVSNGQEGHILWGPYSKSVPGTYDITLHYSVDSVTESDEGIFDVALDTEQAAEARFTSQETSVTIEGVTIEGGHEFEVRVWVPAGMIVRVQSIEYERAG